MMRDAVSFILDPGQVRNDAKRVDEQADHSSTVGFETQSSHIQHQPNLVDQLLVFGNVCRSRCRWLRLGLTFPFLGEFQLSFQIAHGREVLIQASLIGRSHRASQAFGIIRNEVEGTAAAAQVGDASIDFRRFSLQKHLFVKLRGTLFRWHFHTAARERHPLSTFSIHIQHKRREPSHRPQ